MLDSLLTILTIAGALAAGLVMLYVCARVVTRAVTRTLDERKGRQDYGEEEEA
jgi:hypothetical protein